MIWIILVGAAAVAIIGACIWGFFYTDAPKQFRYITVITGVVTLIAAVLVIIPLTETESFKRSIKSFQSEFQGGITREIIVYSEGGEEIYRDQGKFDVEHSEERLKWVDESGQVQIIYLGRSSTAVVNEVGEE